MTEPLNDAWATVVRALARQLAAELAPALAEAVRGAAASPSRDADGDASTKDFMTVVETCQRFCISRATFDRILRDPQSGLAEVVVRVPPVTGRVRVPVVAFEAWLRARPTKRGRQRGTP